MSLTNQAQAFIAVAAIVSALLSKLAPFIQRLPGMGDQVLYNSLMQLLNYALNFGGLIGAEALAGTLDWHNLFFYIALALGQSGASALAHIAHTSPLKTQLAQARARLVAPLTSTQVVDDGKNAVKSGVA